jgi:ATP adenylyltransferase
MCRLATADDDEAALVVERTPTTVTAMNLFPYTSGHLMVLPVRHLAALEELTDDEQADVARAQVRAVLALKVAYAPDGVNVGLNLGAAAGAGIVDHLHVHVLPRWVGDTNFMTTVAESRVLPEDLRAGYAKLRSSWPVVGGARGG